MNNKYLAMLAIALFLAIPIYGQAITETGVGSNIVTTINPPDPKAGDFVTISIEGYGFNAEQAFFDWSKDGKRVLSGPGKNSYSFQLGKIGVQTKVSVGVSLGTKKLADKNFYFEPSDIDFIWQADTYTPPLYKGKALAVAGAPIKIIASPYVVNSAGQLEKDSNLVFSWQQNGQALTEQSGLGKNMLLITPGLNQSQVKIDLSASTADGRNSASKSLIINLSKPEIGFYEIKPLSGLNFLKQVVGEYDLYGDEVTFIAFPYFWPKILLGAINYAWTVNGISAKNPNNPAELVVRQPGGGAGQNEISLQLKGRPANISGRFNIKFGNNLLKFNNDNQ